jgi:CheY-like chemotaxis protein
VRVYVQSPEKTGSDHVAIEFADTGIGISEEFRPYLFKDFKQESDGLTREHEGSGLGLSITKQLVEAMDGTISVESEPGEGSVFTISFPLADVGTEETQSPETDHSSSPSHREARVLLVEDNDNTVFLIQDLLEKTVDLTTVKSARDALDAAGEKAFDLFLVDVNLGAGGSGIDVMKALREKEAYADAPILAVTAIAMPGDRTALLEEGFDDYLAKPFEAGDLLDMIDAHL